MPKHREWHICTVGGQIKLGHLKFNLCKSDHSIVNIFVSVYIICHTKVNLFVIKPQLNDANLYILTYVIVIFVPVSFVHRLYILFFRFMFFLLTNK
jgi:transcriptional antiterminator